ncbi:hypothetical protein DTO013E5_4217 [Penicillium roqueforti]|uniref:DUF202 domain-containing protein n=1 Tax=Penicillium roqueforti (strain FM164) TaxID=1365484 RepID=W6QBH3_PENRF|nr:uncharacterized protein LCP9604111_4203 [Penicillium roqueforti]CDM27027.1 Domain of unknown function DUF202 [Penicillium roqueforti FM164]KAF9249574.1 hypothetical protein LCP9604111_4203 [Penicillium roqueforti]KAI1835115.1 hypothetical protein CBS147337_3932 [Penicillium roqueforti]KAI2677128.1 hypothetical protein CBS147355_5355 [Penicillium roqueforti]KAI2688574.1 hypothetical protein LCP963914a_2976 [Penicillium roqueforti]
MTEPGQTPIPEEPPNAILTDSHPTPARDARDDNLEALELHEIQTREDNELDYSTPSGSSGDENHVPTHRTTSQRDSRRRREARKGLWSQICRFWTRNVSITVPQKSNRDHFALERTFLAYIRTSMVIAMQGVLVAQLFRLQRPLETVHRLSFYHVGIPLAVACHAVAVIVALIGSFRFWRQQNAIARGKVYAGGWELNSVGILLFLVIVATLVLTVIILIETNLSPSVLSNRISWP